jgi:hypothetical protein
MFGNKAKGIGGFYLSGKDADGKKFKKVIDIKTLQHVDYDTKATYPVVEAAKAFKTIHEKIKYIFNNSEFAMRLLSCEFVYSVNRIRRYVIHLLR